METLCMCLCDGMIGGRLYWTDIQTSTIGWVDVDGKNTSVILQSTGSRFFGMDIYLNDLFVTDWGLPR